MTTPTANWNHGLEVFAVSDVGMRRANNQDAHVVALARDQTSWYQRGHVFIVADGMGAHAAGELASKMAVDSIPHGYQKLDGLPPAAAISRAILDANDLIHSRGQASADFEGMGTTCSTLVLLPQGALVAHVGDSRVYRLRDGELQQLSFDHSLVWEMVAAGQIAEDDIPGYVPKNVITRSLGPHPDVQVDLEGPLPIEPGDIFLLCSDGLTGPVSDEEIGVVLSTLPLEEAVQAIVNLANLRGGPDNITAIGVHVTGSLGQSPEGEIRRVETSAAARARSALWMLAGVCAASALLLGWLQYPVPATVAGACAIAAGVLAMWQVPTRPAPPEVTPLGDAVGKAPYRTYLCRATESMAESFGETVSKLRAAATKDGWHIDWATFNGFTREAEAALETGDYRAAVAGQCRAMDFLIEQLRNVEVPRKVHESK